jgi:hypothetical protein
MPESTSDTSSCQEFANSLESLVGWSTPEPEPEPSQDSSTDDENN